MGCDQRDSEGRAPCRRLARRADARDGQRDVLSAVSRRNGSLVSHGGRFAADSGACSWCGRRLPGDQGGQVGPPPMRSGDEVQGGIAGGAARPAHPSGSGERSPGPDEGADHALPGIPCRQGEALCGSVLRGCGDEDREGFGVGIEESDLERAMDLGVGGPTARSEVAKWPLVPNAEERFHRHPAGQGGVGTAE